MQVEIWKRYKDTNYEVSNLGNVRRIGATKNRKIQDNGKGYKNMILRINGESKMLYVHRMVAETFIPNPKGLSEVNHKDENKSNNCVSNLEWMSKIDNLHYGTRQERSVSKRSIPVSQYDLQGNLINTYKSAREASRQTGITQGSISYCVKGERKIAGGYMWKAAAFTPMCSN